MKQNNIEMNEYLLLIKKYTGYTVKNPEHSDLKDDIVQEAFIKLLKVDFFSKHDFSSEEDKGSIISYIKRVVKTCYIDQLKSQGYNRRLTKSEREISGNKYKNIENTQFEDVDQSDESLHHSDSPEQCAFIKEAYQWIRYCFDKMVAEINDIKRKEFFEAAFWEFNQYKLPVKKLAHYLGYESTNPTQELNRFTTKVSSCTQAHGITINNLQDQIQIMQEIIEKSEDNS